MTETTPQLHASPPSPEAHGEFIKTQRDRAFSIALRITRSAADAEDAVQESALKFFAGRGGLNSLDGCEPLLFRTVVQCSLDLLRKDTRRGRRERDYGGQGGLHMHATESASALAERDETLALLRGAVDGLCEEERLAVSLCFFEGLSVVDTARTLDEPRETVRARLTRAVEKLRCFLKSKGQAIGAAAILALLWRDGSRTASAALSEKLDAALPGRACAQLPPSISNSAADASEFMPAATVPTHAILKGSAVATAIAAAAVMWWFAPPLGNDRPAPGVPPPAHSSFVSNESSPASQQSSANAPAKNATGLANPQPTGTVAPASASRNESALAATPPESSTGLSKDALNESIREIGVRSAEKAEAQARQIKAQLDAERAENRNPGAFSAGGSVRVK